MRYVMGVAAVLIFVPLVFALLFMMPLEFFVSSWQLFRADSTTEGRVISTQQQMVDRGNTRSQVRYGYSVAGRKYENDRVRAGWISNRGFERGGGAFAESLSSGSPVTVYYDSDNPEFALLAYGWPKWSIGFSLAVWGILLEVCFSGPQDRRPSSHILYGLTKGMLLLGFAIIILLPPTLEPQFIPYLLGGGFAICLLAGLYSRIRYHQTE